MTRFLAIIKGHKIIFNKISNNARPLASIHNELYYIPEDVFICDAAGEDDFCLYDRGGTQPYGPAVFIDPDLVKAYIDLAKHAGGKPSKLDNLFNKLGTKSILGLVVLLLIAYGIIGGMV